MRVLVACEYSGVVRDAFIEKGHEAVSCDLLPTDSYGPHYEGDIFRMLEYGTDWDLMIAHPPCTYLTVAGNKWMKPEFHDRWPSRIQDRADAVDFFMALINLDIPKIAVENPIGIMSRIYQKPTQIIHPYQYGHPWSKATCLWLKNLPSLVPTDIVEPEWDVFPSGNRQSKEHTRTGHIRDPAARAKARSLTPAGIAQAMADQWG